MPALWRHCGDDELGAVFGAFRASRTPEEGLTDLQRMLPALPPAVRAAVARASVESVPGEEAGRSLDALSTTLTPGQRARLCTDLGVA
ncbi:hypothetical protein [Streptomyces wuyuanensis]|uniref:Uncharacterized protein n=1 Tax=Streptomyces wuyuanensis TaxID=1196353 RepID=A0A1G9W2Q3_9ACTN|nr:hypothetical protein [Streptomyces wuyuanensis]SDM78832.1 hypothetical protein SAMN05444921_113110 [Streptomyces wuyuanensis]